MDLVACIENDASLLVLHTMRCCVGGATQSYVIFTMVSLYVHFQNSPVIEDQVALVASNWPMPHSFFSSHNGISLLFMCMLKVL